jgi:peptidoglycan/LPS O-acetylase OafA/YrhL
MKYINAYEKIGSDASGQLDSLRGLSAIIVLIAHAHQIFIASFFPLFSGIGEVLAQSAVMIFFVLSGFLIGKSLTRNYVDNNSLDIQRYFFDRFNRIYPPLIFSLFIVVTLYLLAPYFFYSKTNSFVLAQNYELTKDGYFVDIPSLIGSTFFLNGFLTETLPSNSPLWSLSYEVWYYVIAAMMFKSNSRKWCLMTIILILSLSILNPKFLIHSTIWFSGLLLCIIHNNKMNFSARKTKYTSAFFFLSSIIFAALFIIAKFTGKNFILPPGISIIVFKVFLGVGFAVYLYRILSNQTRFIEYFSKSSAYSYTLYIIHFPIFLFIFGITELSIENNLYLSIFVSFLSSLTIIVIAKKSAKYLENLKLIKINKKITN